MASKKSVSVRLEDFPPEELEHLVLWYPYIRTGVQAMIDHEGNVCVKYRMPFSLPKMNSASEALCVLHDAEASGKLWIRISGAGNLNVMVLERRYGEEFYAGVIKQPSMARIRERLLERPGEDPFARYWGFALQPQTLKRPSRWEGSKIDTDVPELERAQLHIAGIVAGELDAEEPVVRRIAERATRKLKRLVANMPYCVPEFDEKAGYHVARSVVDEIPAVDRAAARRIGARVRKHPRTRGRSRNC